MQPEVQASTPSEVVAAGRSSGRPARARFGLFYTAAWIPYIYIYASVFVITGELSVWPAVVWALVIAVPAALLGLGVVWVTGRITLPSTPVPTFFLAHGFLGVAYSFIVMTAFVGLSHLLWPIMAGEVVEAEADMRAAFWWQLFMVLMVYVAIAGIAYAFRSTMRLREEGNRAARAEALKARAELQALRAQINPHFLFNTLHSTLALVRRDAAAAEDAIEQFADLLRYTTRTQAESLDRVPLADEWTFVQNYLALEQLRLGDRLSVSATMDESLARQLVPAFCLQPLVENAVRHGISPRTTGGQIWLTAERGPDCVVLEVRDDGPGVQEDQRPSNGGLGLRLVRQRLDVLYGGDASCDISTSPGRGFAVRLQVPIEEPETAHLVANT